MAGWLDRKVFSPEDPDEALCRQVDPDAFFTEEDEDGNAELGGSNANTLAAKRTCANCVLRADCLNWAVDNQEVHGVWGGLGLGGRKAYRRQRDMARAAGLPDPIPDMPGTIVRRTRRPTAA